MPDLLTPGEIAPEFEADDLHGRRNRLSNFRGQTVVLYFLRGFT